MRIDMKRIIGEWVWRIALAGTLAWIGWELHQIRIEISRPAEEQTAAAPEPDLQDSIDDLRDDIAVLDQKVDALLIATAQLKP